MSEGDKFFFFRKMTSSLSVANIYIHAVVELNLPGSCLRCSTTQGVRKACGVIGPSAGWKGSRGQDPPPPGTTRCCRIPTRRPKGDCPARLVRHEAEHCWP